MSAPKYLTFQEGKKQIRLYRSQSAALANSVKINRATQGHPKFYLFQDVGKPEARYIGQLTREFVTDNFYWLRFPVDLR